MSLVFEIIASTEGTALGVVSNVCMSCSPEYRLFGGCDTLNAQFIAEFGDDPIATKGDAVLVSRNGIPIFKGRVVTCKPEFGQSIQSIQLNGLWQRLAERPAVDPPLLDHITFGQDPDSDHPTITTGFGVAEWIINNRILNDPEGLITAGSIVAPTYPCKLAGPFVLYAKDQLNQVLETLATMEDCVTGIDAAGRLYYIPREQVLGTTQTTVYVKKEIPKNWRDLGIGIPEGGGQFVFDRRGPNALGVYSRDSSGAPSIRTYNLKNVLPEGTKRTAGIRSANLHTGVQARRYARGLFRRFCDYSMKVEDLEFRVPTKQCEPHLGMFRVEGPEGLLYAENLAGQVKLDIKRTTMTVSVTLGENAADPGSGNPLNDPYANSPGWNDDAQVNTGLGDIGYPIPSGDIDFGDGYDGDGDDLHQNPEREFPGDAPGLGVDGVDYGSDDKNPDNDPDEGGTGFGGMKLGIITAASHPTYEVQLYEADGTTEDGDPITGVACWPEPVPRLQVGQKVLVNYPDGETPYIDGTIHGRHVKLNIKSTLPANQYEVELLDPFDNTTVLATYTLVTPWPVDSTFAVGQKVSGYWFPGAAGPTPLGTGGSSCAVSINSFGVKFG